MFGLGPDSREKLRFLILWQDGGEKSYTDQLSHGVFIRSYKDLLSNRCMLGGGASVPKKSSSLHGL